MNIRVGRKYKDGVGCTVKIALKLDRGDYPYVGVVDWSTCDCKSSRTAEPEVDQYNAKGFPSFGGDCYALKVGGKK